MRVPSDIVREVYHEHLKRFGEPATSIRYDNPPSNGEIEYPSFIDVMIWPADEEVNMTTFATIGMSDKPMVNSEYRVEIHFAVEGKLGKNDEEEITRFLANLSLYPFMNSTFFDWWHTLPNLGDIPYFSNCKSAFLHPAFVEGGWDLICTDYGHVKILNLIPITKEEFEISRAKDLSALVEHMHNNDISYFRPR